MWVSLNMTKKKETNCKFEDLEATNTILVEEPDTMKSLRNTSEWSHRVSDNSDGGRKRVSIYVASAKVSKSGLGETYEPFSSEVLVGKAPKIFSSQKGPIGHQVWKCHDRSCFPCQMVNKIWTQNL